MKRILAALLCFCLLISLVPVPAFAAEDVYINSQESIFPSDTTVRDLYITEDCPSTVILIFSPFRATGAPCSKSMVT